MSILFGYDYFDTTTEDLSVLRQKLAAIEKTQQNNTAEVAKHTNEIVKLNSLGKNYVQYDFTQTPRMPP
jgi:TnpA family transposase